MRDAVLAAQETPFGVDRLHPIPRLGLRDEDGVVVRRHDARVVLDPTDPAVPLFRLLEHRLHAYRIADVCGEEKRFPALRSRLLPRLAAHVGDAHPRTLGRKQERRFATDPTGGAGDDRYLAVKPPGQRLAALEEPLAFVRRHDLVEERLLGPGVVQVVLEDVVAEGGAGHAAALWVADRLTQ